MTDIDLNKIILERVWSEKELPEVLHSYKNWKYCPEIRKIDFMNRKIFHWVVTPINEITTILYTDRLADPSHFNRWVDLGSPSEKELGYLIKTKHHLRIYARKKRIAEILEELGDLPDPSKFKLKEYTNLNLLKKIRKTKITYNCDNDQLPVMMKLLEK